MTQQRRKCIRMMIMLRVATVFLFTYFAQTADAEGQPAWTKPVTKCQSNITYSEEEKRFRINFVRVAKDISVKFTDFKCSIGNQTLKHCDVGDEFALNIDVHKVLRQLQDHHHFLHDNVEYFREKDTFMEEMKKTQKSHPTPDFHDLDYFYLRKLGLTYAEYQWKVHWDLLKKSHSSQRHEQFKMDTRPKPKTEGVKTIYLPSG